MALPDESSIDDLFSDEAPASSPPDGGPVQARGALTFTCSKCGKKSAHDETVRFCPHCGAPAQAGGSGGPTTVKVLLVDDAAIARKKIGAVLKSLGCSVAEAKDGVEALATVDEVDPHLVVLDINMPNMSGIEVLDELRGKPRYQNTTIVMLTAEADAAVVSEALKHRANDYLRKDARVDQLKERLLKHIGRIRAGG